MTTLRQNNKANKSTHKKQIRKSLAQLERKENNTRDVGFDGQESNLKGMVLFHFERSNF